MTPDQYIRNNLWRVTRELQSLVSATDADRDELFSAGMQALLDYVSSGMRGHVGTVLRRAIIGRIRSLRPESQSFYRDRAEYRWAELELTRDGREVTDDEVFDHLTWSTTRRSAYLFNRDLAEIGRLRAEDVAIPDASDSPDEAAGRSDRYSVLNARVDELPARLRSAVSNHFYRDMSFAEIAGREGCSKQLVHARVKSALKRLRIAASNYRG